MSISTFCDRGSCAGERGHTGSCLEASGHTGDVDEAFRTIAQVAQGNVAVASTTSQRIQTIRTLLADIELSESIDRRTS